MLNRRVMAGVVIGGLAGLLAFWQRYYAQYDYGPSFAWLVALTSMASMGVCVIVLRRPGWRWLGWLVALILYLNFVLSDIAHNLYGYGFNVGFAYSLWNSDFEESAGFIELYWPRLLALSLGLILALVALHWSVRQLKPLSWKWAPLCLLLVAGGSLNGSFRQCSSCEGYRWLASLLRHSPAYNFQYFADIQAELNFIDSLAAQPAADLGLEPQIGQQVFVLVIGESALRSKLSLYGYKRPTTPNLERRRQQLWLATQAIAPAPVTIFSVPASLSRLDLFEYRVEQVTDNIIERANQAGFDTYWFSRQGQVGQFNNLITIIARRAGHQHWLRQGFDGDLLPAVEQALQAVSDKPKLIVLHTNGSHEPACGKYPPEFEHFQGRVKYEDCYDNSIRYTDAWLEQLMQRLADKPASLLYFSDHGLERDEQSKYLYFHGGKTPSKMAYDVPLFIWYAQPHPLRGRQYHKPYAMAGLDLLLNDWLGLSYRQVRTCLSPLSECYQPDTDVWVSDADLQRLNYRQLPPGFVRRKP